MNGINLPLASLDVFANSFGNAENVIDVFFPKVIVVQSVQELAGIIIELVLSACKDSENGSDRVCLPVPFRYAKWIFLVCIVLSFVFVSSFGQVG